MVQAQAHQQYAPLDTVVQIPLFHHSLALQEHILPSVKHLVQEHPPAPGLVLLLGLLYLTL